MKLFILLPCYNEGEALPYLLDSIQKKCALRYADYEVVVVNDGSTDDTLSVAEMWKDRLNISILNHEFNMGLGEALNTGLSYFYDNCSNDDVIVIMDADNTHDPGLIPRLLDSMENERDVVIASRYVRGGKEIGLSLFRKICSAGASLLLSVFFAIPHVKDYTCGYRAYKGDAIKKVMDIYKERFIEEKGFTCMAEILIKMYFAGCSISEVPLVLRYDLKKGRSKMKVAETIKRYFVLISNLKRYKNMLHGIPVLLDGKGK